MSTLYDASFGIATETTYKTYAAPGRHFEYIDEGFTWDKGVKVAQGLRVGRRGDAVERRYVPTADGKGSLDIELANKGMGLLFNAALGASTSTIIAATTAYQQVHTYGDAPASLTVQKGIPRITAATGAVAAVDPITFLGCVVTDVELTFPVDGIATAKFGFDVGDYTTAQSLAAITLPTGMYQFHGDQITTTSFGGTLTGPTTTALASVTGATAVGFRDFSVKIETPYADDRFNGGAAGRKSKPAIKGLRKVTGKFTAEYDSVTFRDAYLADTTVPLLLSYQGANISGANYDAFQVVIPAAKLDQGMPMANNGDIVLVDYNFTAYEPVGGGNQISLVQVSTDTAI